MPETWSLEIPAQNGLGIDAMADGAGVFPLVCLLGPGARARAERIARGRIHVGFDAVTDGTTAPGIKTWFNLERSIWRSLVQLA